MPDPDKRNVLRVGPPEHPGGTEITPAMVENVRQRIKDAGGILTVWAVLHGRNPSVYRGLGGATTRRRHRTDSGPGLAGPDRQTPPS